MNEKNLEKGKATQFQAGEEQAITARKGGKKSGESRRKKADIKATVQDILNDEYSDKSGRKLSGVAVLVVNLFKIAADPKNKQCLTAMKMIFDIYNDKDKNKLLDQKTKAEIKLLEAKLNAISGSNEKFNEDEMPKLWKALGEENDL